MHSADFDDPATAGRAAPATPRTHSSSRLCYRQWTNNSAQPKQQQCRGEQEDGSLTLKEAQAALASLPRGKSLAVMGSPMRLHTAMWEVVGEPWGSAFDYR